MIAAAAGSTGPDREYFTVSHQSVEDQMVARRAGINLHNIGQIILTVASVWSEQCKIEQDSWDL